MELCASCGKIKATQREACPSCGSSYPEKITRAVVKANGDHWAHLVITHTCQACGEPLPLNHLHSEQEIYCPSCKETTPLPLAVWCALFERCHALLDLFIHYRKGDVTAEIFSYQEWISEQDAQALMAEFQSCGALTDQIRYHFATKEAGSFHLALSPGVPLCESCDTQLRERERELGQLHLYCPGCNRSMTYDFPLMEIKGCSVRGVMAPEHRKDLPLATFQESGDGPPELSCPDCGWSLHGATSTVTTCPSCGLTCRILTRHLPTQASPKNRGFWVAFDGTSATFKAMATPAKRAKKERIQSGFHQAIVSSHGEPRTPTPKTSQKLALAILGGVFALLLMVLLVLALSL